MRNRYPEEHYFKDTSLDDICDQLASMLSKQASVSITAKKEKQQLDIRNGIWRGAVLIIDNDSEKIKLIEIVYSMFSFPRVLIVWVSIMMLLSVVVSTFSSVYFGEVRLGYVVLGAIPGALIGMQIEDIVLWWVRKTWCVELDQALEGLRA